MSQSSALGTFHFSFACASITRRILAFSHHHVGLVLPASLSLVVPFWDYYVNYACLWSLSFNSVFLRLSLSNVFPSLLPWKGRASSGRWGHWRNSVCLFSVRLVISQIPRQSSHDLPNPNSRTQSSSHQLGYHLGINRSITTGLLHILETSARNPARRC